MEDVSASEGAGALEFTVTLANGATATGTVSVDYATTDGDALEGNDYSSAGGTLTIPTGASSGVISVPVNNDRVAEYDETFTLTLSNPSNAALPGGANSVAVTGTILDNERTQVTITARQDEVFVGQTIDFDITRLGSAEKAIIVSMQVEHRTMSGSTLSVNDALLDDYSDYPSAGYTIPAGERELEWSMQPDDGFDEDYILDVKLIRYSQAGYDRGGPVTVTVRQRPAHQSSDPSGADDSWPAVTIAAGSGGEDSVPTVAEGEEATFTLTRSGDTSEVLTAWVHTEEPHHPDWTPGDGENPSAQTGFAIFQPGSATATLYVNVADDGVAESSDWLEAHVSPIDVSLFRRGDPHRAVVNIVDERVDHDNLDGLREIGIEAIQTSVDEGERILVNTLQPEIEYSTAPYAPLNVKVHVSQDGSGVPEDRLGITASVHTKIAAVKGRNRLGFPTLTDDGDEPDTTVTFTLLESPEYRIDPDKDSVTVTIKDKDLRPMLEIADATASSGAESIDFQVSFANGVPSYRTVTVDYRTEDGTAKKDTDYVQTRGTLTIPPGETGGVITVPLVDNPNYLQNQTPPTFQMHLQDPSNARLPSRTQATATLAYRPNVDLTARQLEIEAGETATFDLTRDGTPASELTVRVSAFEVRSAGTQVGTPEHYNVTFAAGNAAAELSIENVAELSDPDHFLKLEVNPPSFASYEHGTDFKVFLKVYDPFTEVNVAAEEGPVTEGEDADATFTLVRTGDSLGELPVTVHVDDPMMLRCGDHADWADNCPEGPSYETEVTFSDGSATAALALAVPDDRRDVPEGSALTVTVTDTPEEINRYRPGDSASASVAPVDDDHASTLTYRFSLDGDTLLYVSQDSVREGAYLGCGVERDETDLAYEEEFDLLILDGRGGYAEETIVPVRMAIGQRTHIVPIDISDDSKSDNDWTVSCQLQRVDDSISNEAHDQYFKQTIYYHRAIRVRDAGAGAVTIAADQAGITEGETASFTLTRGGNTTRALAVRVSVADPGDFMRGNGYWPDPQPPTTVEFAAGSGTATLSLPTRDDWRDIPDGELTVTIEDGDSRHYRPGDPSSASVTVQDNDTKPVIELTVNGETLTEGDTVVFTLTRTVDFTHDVDILLDVVIQGELRRHVLGLSPENPVLTLEYATEDDGLDEADVVYRITAVDPDNDYRTVAEPHTVVATVEDNDLPRVSIEAPRAAVSEGESFYFNVVREGQTTRQLRVYLNVSQTGAAIKEIWIGPRSQPIYNGHDLNEIAVHSIAGDGDEHDQSVTFEVLEHESYVIDPARSTATVTVRDTDPRPTLQVSGTDDTRSVSEDGGAMEFRVFYEGPLSQKEVTVDYSTQSGGAAAGVDYTATFGTLTFADGETEGAIPVPVSQDSLAEYDETFFLTLSNPGNARLEDDAQSVTALATIKDDEPRVSVAPAAEEVTEGEPAVFNLTRTGDTSAELMVWMSFRERRPGSAYSSIAHLNDAFQPGESTLQVSRDTPDDDVDTPPFTLVAIVRTPSEFQRPNSYLPGVYQTSVTVLDNDLPTVTIEAAEDRREENEDAEFTLTRRGDPTDPLTVNLAVTQEGDYLDGTPPSTVTFAAGGFEATLTVPVENDTAAEVHGSVTAAISSGDYITGNPGSATVEIADNDRAHTTVLSIAGNGPVTEGEDVVFTITRTGGIQLDLVVPVTLTHVWHSDGQPEYSDLEVERLQFSEETVEASFEPGDTAATLAVATENENLNDGNSFFKASIALTFDYSIDPDSQLAAVWVRDDDIPTVTVTPAYQVHFELDPDDFEDPSTRDLAPKYTLHRTGDTSTFLRVDLRSPWVKHYTWGIDPSLSYNNPDYQDSRPILRDESSHEWLILVTRVPPLGADGWVYLKPRFCPDTTDERCGTRPQYLVGEENTHHTKIFNNFMAVAIEADQSSVVEGQPATFTLNRYGGNPDNKWNPLRVRVEVTQDGEYIKGLPPQEVTFRGYPETTTEGAEQTITLSIPTDDDAVDEAHGAITVRILPPVVLEATTQSYEIESNTEGFESQAVTVQVTDNDYDPPPISIADARAGESDGSMEFFVTVAPSEREMSVSWNTVTETGVGVATADTDYDGASGKLTFAIGETTKTITVAVLDDEQAETDETFKVVLDRPNNATQGRSTGTGTIEDDDEGTVVTIHAQNTYGGTEEGQPAEFILQRVGGTAPIDVELAVSQEGDFLASPQTTTITQLIPDGAMEATLQVPTEDDSAVEANGSVTVTLKPPDASESLSSYTAGDPDEATVNMRDNDRTLSISDLQAGEGDGLMTFTITLSSSATDQVRVEAFTQSGAATASPRTTATSLGRDFQGKIENVVFEPGETEKSFTVTLVDDDIDEPSEDFTVKLSRPSSNVWLTDDSATGTITDNDDPMEARISRQAKRVDEARTGPVVFAVELTHDDTGGSERDTRLFWQVTAGTATEGEDYTKPYSQQRGTLDIPMGHLTATIEVTLIDDDLLEQELETFTVELVAGQRLGLPDNESDKKVEISIRDDERLTAAITPREDSVVEGDSAVFEVRLSGGVTMQDTELEYTVAGTADSGDDYTAPSGTLTITAGSDAGTITMDTLPDSTLDPGETVEVTLTSGKSGSRNASIPDPTAAVTILETGTLTVSVAPAVAEEGGTLSFAVTLSLASRDGATVDWRTADDPGAESAATADVDYAAASGTLTVPAESTSAFITVETLDDTLAAEGAETFRLDLVRARIGQDAEALPLGVSTAVGTILDNDIAPAGMTLAAAPDRVSEDAGAAAVTVTATLNGQRSLARDTRVQLALEDGSAAAGEDYGAATARLTIPAGQMSAAATLTLTPVNDAVREGDETVSIAGTAVGLAVTPAQVTITDDDSSPTGVTLTLEPDAVGEGAGETDLTVTAALTGGDLRTVDTEVRLSVEGVSLTLEGSGATTAATAADFAAGAVTLTIPALQTGGSATLAFTPADDTLFEGNETAQVTGAAEGLTVTPAGLTIEDNDREPTRIALSVSPLEVTEGDGDTTLMVTATLEGGGSRISGTEVSLSVQGLTAIADADFTAQQGVTLTIPAGQLSHTADLTLTPVDDDVAEGTEQLVIRGSNAEPGLPVSGVRVTLTDNDAQPMAITLSLDRNTVAENGGAQRLTVTAVLEGDSRRTVDTSVRLRLVGQTAGESDYSAFPGVLTIKAGESEGAATLVLVPRDDHIDEDDETLEVTGSTAESRTGPALEVSGVLVTITDDDTAGVIITPTELFVVEGGSGSYRVSLATQPSADVTVTVAGHADTDITLSGDTLTDDVLTFTPDNWSSAQTVTATAVQDDDATAPPDVTLTHTVTGTGEYAGVTAAAVVVSVTDNDAPGVTVSKTELTIEEGGSATYTVVLDTKPTDDVTVAIAGHADTDITLSGDTLTNDALTFTPDNWDTAQTVTVTAGQDDDAASDAAVTLTHTAGGGDYVAATADVVVSITEDDEPGVTIPETELTIVEGATATYTVVLDTKPTDDVTVAIAGHADTDITLSGDTLTNDALTFTPDNWDTAQTVTVTAGQDDDAASDAAVTLTHTADGGDYVAATADVVVSITEDDEPGVTIPETELTIVEGATATYTVVLDTKPTDDVTVAIVGHADTDITLSGDTLTFTASTWNTVQTVTVTAGEDNDAASDAAVTLTHTANGGGYVDVQETVTVTIVEKDAAVLSVSNAEAGEAGGNVVFTVSISAASGSAVTVDYATSDGTAAAGQDYTETGGTLTFPALVANSQTILVPIIDDADDEAEQETFTLTLSSAQGASLAQGGETLTVTGTITDDDDPAVTASFRQASYSVAEGGTVEVTVTLSADPEREVTILLTHVPQGDTGSADYSGVPGSLVFQIGDTEKSFTFSAAADDIDDDGESVALGFGTMPDRVTAGTTATVTITDDDTVGVTISETALNIDEGENDSYTVVLDTEPTDDVTVAVAGHSGTDISLDKTSLTFTASTWDTAQTVTVTAGEDNDAASDAAVTLTHTANGGGYVDVQETVTVTIVEKDAAVLSVSNAEAGEAGGNVVFTVSISAASGSAVTVDYATSDGTAAAGQDYTETGGTLTFPALVANSQTILVPIIDDADDEAEQETFTLTLSSAQGASLAQGGETLTVTGTITDDDDPAVTASFRQASYSVAEGGTVEVTVTLSADPEREVTILLTHVPQGDTGSADYSGVPGSLVFQIGDTEKSFTFSAAADDIDDDGESVALGFGTMPDGVSPGTTATVSITDDDAAGVSLSETALSIDEGGSGSYTVVLDTQPTADVTVAIAGHAGTDISLDQTSLTFTASTWDTAQTVTVTAGEDDDAASDAAVTLTHTANGGGYLAVQETVTVTIVEKDAAVLSVSNAEAGEASGNVVFTVSISAAAGQEVTVEYATSNGTATAGQDYTETTGTLTFAANSVASQTISVPVTDDAVDEAEEETFTLTLSSAQGASLAGGASTLTVTGTITDDDPAVTASFGQAAYSVDEGGTVEVTVTLSADPEREVTILLTHVPQGNTGSADYSGVPGSLVFQIGDTEKSFTFSATDDDIDDDGESVALGFGTMPDDVTAGTTATVTITDDDAAGVSLSETALSIDEGGSGSYTVVLDTQPTADVTVAIVGHADTDITLSGDTLTFTASTWNTVQTVTVTAGEDNDAASDAAVTLTHTANGGGYVDVQETVTVTIVEKDTSVLSVDNAEAAEDAGNVAFTVSISAASGSAVTVDYATSDGTAAAGQDYTETGGTLTFPALVANSQTILVPIIDDADDEAEQETFTLTLSSAQGASLAQGGETLTVTGTITDDDDPAVTASFGQAAYSVDEGGTVEVTVTLSADPEREVTILLTHVPQGNTGSADYSGVPGSLVFQIGDTEKSFTFSATDDDIDDDGESVVLGFGTMPDRVTAGAMATVTITDDDQRGVTIAPTSFTVLAGQSNKYSVVLNSQPTGDVMVTVSGQSGTDLTVSPASLTFTASNWNTAREVTATADNNASRASVTLTHTASGGDYVDVQETVTVTIVGQPQDLVIQVGVTASQQEMTVVEGGSNTYSLVLSSAPTGDVTISVNVPTGNDLAASPASLTFTSENWDTMQTVTVSAAEDDDAIADDAVDIGHTVSGLGDAEIPSVRATIIENDTPDVTVAPTELTIGEGGTGQYTVVLDTLPSDNVTVAIAVPSGTDLSVTPSGPLTFTAATWSQAQAVTVTAAEDDDADTDPAVTLTHTVTGGDYEGRDAAGVTVSITENDHSVSFSASDYTATEGGDDAQVTVLLNAPAPSSIDIPLTTEGMNGATSDDWSGVPEEVTFNTGDTSRTFTVTATDDDVEDNNEMVALGFGDLPDSVVRGTPDRATVTLMNDDGNGPGTDSLTPAMTCGPDNTWSGEITQPGQMDRWYWHLDGNDKYSGPADHGIVGYAVNMMGVGSGEGTLQDPHIFRIQGLYDGTPLSPLGGTIPSWWGNDRGKGWDSLVSHDIQHTGVYQATVGANPFGDAANGTGTYKICVMGPGPFSLEEPPERRLVVQPDLYMTGEDRDTYTVGLSAPPEETATVWVDPVFNSTSEHFSVTPKRMIFTAEDWDTPQVVTITRKASAPAHIDDSGFLIEHDTSGYDYFGAGTMAYFHTWKSSVDDHLARRKPLSERNNSPAMGEPDISGTAQVGQTLTATTADILDLDGLTGVVYEYQWYRHHFATGLEDPIEGATGSSYTVTDADACTGIVVGVIFTDDAGYRQGLSSFPVPVPPQGQADCPNNPATGAPDISGTAQVGETLTAGTHGIRDVDGMIGVDFAYRWVRHDFDTAADTDIAGATGASYTVTLDDEGKGIRVRVSFTDNEGFEESLTSEATGAVSAPPPPPDNVGAVTQKSGAVELTWDAPDDATVIGYRIERRLAGRDHSVQQRSGGRPRDNHTLVQDTGSADTGYTDKSAEKGVEYEYRISARNEAGPGEASDWARAVPAPASNNPATGAPTISGAAQVGETLTADITGIADADGLSGEAFTYQWVSGDGTTDTDMENATGATYTLVDADQGKAIKVRVTFTDGGGNEETLTSAPTGPVLGDGPPGAPRNLTATAGNKEVTLSWDPPADNGNAPATGYRIEWRVDGKDYDKNLWGTARSTTYTTNDQANLANGVKYFFRVKAGNGSGYSYGPYGPASGEVSATPTSGSAVDLGTPVLSDTETLHHGMVRLDWEDVEDAGWYVVQYYHVKGGEWLDLPAEGVDIAFHGSSAVVSNLHGLSWLRVRAMSCAGASEWSQIEQLFGTNASDWEGVPVPEVEAGDEIEPCPVVLGTPVLSDTETLHHGMVKLDWQDIEGAGWYVVQYYHVKGGEWLDLPAEGVDIAFHGSSAVVSNLHGLSWLRVRAMSCAGESEWSQIEQLFGTNASDWEGVPVPDVAEGDEIEPCSEDADTPDNSPATGAPTITGTVQVGETLTADTSGIADADGLSSVQYEYQWLADDYDISGATNATYTLVAADEGKAIKVQVSFTDDAGNDESLTSAATEAVAAAPTPNTPATGAPSISGTVRVGETLTVDTSDIVDADGLDNAAFAYQWTAGGPDIEGATGASYTIIADDEGLIIQVRVSFTDDAGNPEALTSAPTDAVQPPPNSPTITGTVRVGETLTADTSAIADADGMENAAFTYQWIAGGADIEGATGASYTIIADDEGLIIQVWVSFTDDAGNYETRISDGTEAVAPETPPNTPATGAPTITGTVRVGETLTADTSAIADADGMENAAFTYQWIAGGADIEGATGTGYTIIADDEGLIIQVWVSFTDDADNYETRISDGTEAVAPETPPNTPATGAPTITGTVRVGETLTADTSAIADADGMENAAFTYQWIAGGADIEGATGAGYTIIADDEGLIIQVWVSFTDDAGNYETRISAATDAVAAAPTPNSPATGAPAITGTVRVGETLTVDTSDIVDADGMENAVFDYQWVAGGADIEGATGAGYTIIADDEGLIIQVWVSFTDDAGNGETLTSAATDAVAAAPTPNSPATGAPNIGGTAQVGDTLTANTSEVADADGLSNVQYEYQWLAGDSDIAGATGSTYTLADTDEGKAIKVEVSFTDDAGNEETLTSAATDEVAAAPQTNSPATGAPAISGTAQVGETLAADTSGIADADGLSNVQYQWLADNADIPGATASTYTLSNSDEGKAIKVEVTFTDDAGNGETLTSAATDAVAAAPTPNSPATGAPTITGTVRVGETLTANTSGISDEDGLDDVSFTYQWTGDGEDIAGATNATYTLAEADKDKTVTVQVSFADDLGNQETLTSPATDAVAAQPTPNTPATGAPTIDGTAQVGEELTAGTSGIADEDGLENATFGYQWLADDAEIAGATGSTYTLAAADEGKAIKVEVTFIDDSGNDEALTSVATDAVAARPNSFATGAPTISGTAQVGETLTADTSGISDADGISNVQYEYQWLGDDADISGATNATYTPADTDEGKAIKVQVSFTDDAGNEETLTSAATDAVATAEPLEPPDKPRGLEATATPDSVTLTWNDPQDESITGYVILRRVRVNDQGGDFSVLVANTGRAATTYTDDEVAASTTYTYRIKAINEHGVSERSRWVHIDTPAPPVPDKPTGLSATATHDQVVLTWDDPGDDSITGYVILRRLPGVDPEGQFDELVANTGSAATTYTDNEVAAENRYTYRIKAINEHGTSERSRWFHVDTPAAP